jgi:hypothetical protein
MLIARWKFWLQAHLHPKHCKKTTIHMLRPFLTFMSSFHFKMFVSIFVFMLDHHFINLHFIQNCMALICLWILHHHNITAKLIWCYYIKCKIYYNSTKMLSYHLLIYLLNVSHSKLCGPWYAYEYFTKYNHKVNLMLLILNVYYIKKAKLLLINLTYLPPTIWFA